MKSVDNKSDVSASAASKPETMQAIVIQENAEVQVENVPVPQLTQPDEVMVKVAYSGLCGSDIPRIFAKGAHFYPITLGHEFSGQVIECGQQVNDLQPGDNIACVPLLPCFQCPACQRQYYSLCKKYQFVGSRSGGGNTGYIALKRKSIFKLPQGVSLLQGAFFEPITVGLHALLLAGGCENKNIVLIGAGTIGLLAMQCAKAMGAASISVIDINPDKLTLAKQLGATDVYNSAELTSEQIRQQMQDRQFEQLILETAGAPATVTLSLDIAGPRAQVALIGTLHHDLTLSHPTFGLILRKELNIIGSWMNYSGNWPGDEWKIAADLFSRNVINLDPLIASINDAQGFARQVMALKGKPMNGKLLVKFS